MSAATEQIREFFQRLNAANPSTQSTGTFLDKIEALLKERDEMFALLQSLHQHFMEGRNSVGRPTLEAWAEEIDDVLTRAEGES